MLKSNFTCSFGTNTPSFSCSCVLNLGQVIQFGQEAGCAEYLAKNPMCRDGNYRCESSDELYDEAEYLWIEYQLLLSEFFPAPNPTHRVHVALFETYYGNEKHVLNTSFPTISDFLAAAKDYKQTSIEVLADNKSRWSLIPD